MKNSLKLLLIGIIALSLPVTYSCNDGGKGKEETPRKEEQGRIFGLFKDSLGKWNPALLFVVRSKQIKYDSLTKKDEIVWAEIFGVDRLVFATTTDGKTILDSITHKPRMTLTPIRISSDSIMWKNIEGILIDSLAKKK